MSTSGSGSKAKILSYLKDLDKDGRVLVNLALDPYTTFGVNKFDYDPVGSETSVMPFVELANSLARRDLTGNKALEKVREVLSSYSKRDADMLARVLRKDLKAGFSAETFNSVVDDHRVPVFSVMLADKCDSPEDFDKRVKFPAIAEHKYDGERTIALVDGNSVTYYSRSGKVAHHVEGLFDEELLALRDYFGCDIAVDGERIAGSFAETMNSKKKENLEAKANMRFRLFFIMPIQVWISQDETLTMEENRESILGALEALRPKRLLPAHGRTVADYSEMMEYCDEAIDKFGVEGLIIKNPSSRYKWDRSYDWVKVKRFYDVDCKVMSAYRGRPNSRLKDTLGGLNVAGYTENGVYVETSVGSGFSDKLREEIWNNPEKYTGLTAVIKYQELSLAKNAEHHSLRFPVFVRFRDDKLVEL